MFDPVLVGGLDVAEMCVYVFFAFFLGLIFYLRREDRREGYPLEEADTGRRLVDGGPLINDAPKRFLLPFGMGEVWTPTQGSEPVDLPNARRVARIPDSPYEPVGDPLAAGIGPGAFAKRRDTADLDWEGRPRIVPMRADPSFTVEPRDPDPRGYRVAGDDDVIAGEVTDLWIDRAEAMVRYLEVELRSGRSVLVPMTMLVVDTHRRAVLVSAINGAQFEGAPGIASSTTVTRYEEERIIAYFGGGYLYATADRAEPMV